jgi:MoaA/NifB/PqqE/SkfB family radical SAM enzyme
MRQWFYRWVARSYLKKPGFEDLLRIKYPTTRSVVSGALNELHFRLGSERAGVLTSINIEVTNTCNLACVECPVNTTMARKKGFMDPALFRKLIDETPTLDFVLVFQWGEPLLHREFFDMVAHARSRGVRVLVTTNGTKLAPDNRKRLLASGLERITFSVDGLGEVHTKIRGYPFERLRADIATFRRERDAAGLNGKAPAIDVSMVAFDDTAGETEKVEEFRRAWDGVADRVQVIPRFHDTRRVSKCREPWRGTLVVLWDGRVSVCCRDWEGEMIVGDATREPLSSIWNGEPLRAIRRAHVKGAFPALCARCGEYEAPGVDKRFS